MRTLRRIEVNNAGEYGTFFVEEDAKPRTDGSTQYTCQLTCNTAFGVVGTFWASMGMPATQFLAKANKDYVLGRLWGSETEEYDETTARDALKESLLRDRRAGLLEADGARTLWDELEDADLDNEHAHTVFVYGSSHWYEQYSDGGGPKCKRRNPQAEGFWEHLWPDFIKQLQTNELVTAATPKGTI